NRPAQSRDGKQQSFVQCHVKCGIAGAGLEEEPWTNRITPIHADSFRFSPTWHSKLRAKGLYFAMRAIRPAGEAATPAMPNQPMAEHRPLVLGHELHQLRFDLLGGRFFCQADSL